MSKSTNCFFCSLPKEWIWLSVVEELESVVTANFQRATRIRQSILQKGFSRRAGVESGHHHEGSERRRRVFFMKHHQRKCRCCKKWFATNPCNHHHQRFCLKIKCRKASKAASQKRWQSKPANRHHWCGPDEVERVRVWRKLHPFYWKRGRRK